jgi:solute carrier family 25 S-adenosylmethionine transporter 26
VEGFKHSLASGLAAVVSKTLLAPFDTIKTIQQQKTASSLGYPNIRFFQAVDEIMSRPKGFLEFYSGLGVSAIGAMPSVGLYFGVYSMTKQTLGPWMHRILSMSSSQTGAKDRSWVNTFTVALSAAIGNTVASFSRVPYEVIKQKLQTGQYSGTWTAIQGMIRESSSNPIRAFFPKGGVSAQMMRDVPYAVFTLVSYETLRNIYHVHRKKQGRSMDTHETNKQTAPWADMMIGAIAGGIGSYLTNPMDVIKTRMQMDTDGSLYHGKLWYCLSQTYLKDGPSAFLRGSIPRLLHKVPANGAFFLFYEWFRLLLRVNEYSQK